MMITQTRQKTRRASYADCMMNEKDRYPLKDLTEKIIGAAYVVHNTLGSGFAEKVYENALSFELRSKGFRIEQQKVVIVCFYITSPCFHLATPI